MKSLRPPPPNNSKYKGLWIHCSRCGVGICLGIGCVALVMPLSKQMELLVKSKWQCAPVKLCPNCRDYYLFYHPESDCIFWSAGPILDPLLELIGRSRYKSVHEAKRLWFEYRPGDNEYFNKSYKP